MEERFPPVDKVKIHLFEEDAFITKTLEEERIAQNPGWVHDVSEPTTMKKVERVAWTVVLVALVGSVLRRFI